MSSNGIFSNIALHHLVDVGCKDRPDGLPDDKVEWMTWCCLKKLQAYYSVSRGFYYYAGYYSGKYRKSDNSYGQLEDENRRDFYRHRKSSRGDIALSIVQIQDKCYARLVKAIGSYHLNHIKKSYDCIKIHYKDTRELLQLGRNKFTDAELSYVTDAGRTNNVDLKSYCSSTETSEKIKEERIIKRQSSNAAEHRIEMSLRIRRAEHRQATINEMEWNNCESVRALMRESRSYTKVKTLQSEMKKSLEYRWDAKEQVCNVRCRVKLVESFSVSQSNCRISARIHSSINNDNNEAVDNVKKSETADCSASSHDDCSTCSNVVHRYEGAYTVINVSVRQVTWRATITCR